MPKSHIELAKEMDAPDGLHAQFYSTFETRYQVHSLSENHVGISALILPKTDKLEPIKNVKLVLDRQTAIELFEALRSVLDSQEQS